MDRKQGTLKHWVIKDDEARRMRVVGSGESDAPPWPGAKQAILHFESMAKAGKRRLIRIQLETGRKHQIRVQLAAMGYPVIGDRKYGSGEPFRPGIALHSYQLTISHPTKRKKITIRCPVPPAWEISRFGLASDED